ncbi:VOC family protein [Thalassotalea sp. M1531]|uniref:VOC family protein n=1 Tax=Thalassotalea algicola TaxID=2716224 RepID=A0A7Y0LF51_9GAMM|nr:VOC family protein [Thalassotalea algicola]NMP32020.1 VOC family protein [Thalassotalea algicola]
MAKINYLELAASNLPAVKNFYQTVFNWQFTDYGPEYTAFSGDTIDGGFYQADAASSQAKGGVLIVFYSDNLATTQHAIESAGGNIIKPVFEFPGGRRFHFTDPCNNELAVWSDK